MTQPCDMDLWVMKWRSALPIFHSSWFCLISWRLFDACTSYFRSMNQYDPTFDLKINVGQCDIYFKVQRLCLIPWRLIHIWTSLFGIMNPYDPTHDLKISVGQGDLYFMVQWLCVISGRLFDVWTSSLGIMGQYDLTFYLKVNVCHCDLYFMVHWFCLISQWMSVIFSDNEKVWPKPWPQNKYRSTWPIFHGLVILLNIFKIIRWTNIIIGIMDQCDTKIDLIKYM